MATVKRLHNHRRTAQYFEKIVSSQNGFEKTVANNEFKKMPRGSVQKTDI
jgi:hypothetical protein